MPTISHVKKGKREGVYIILIITAAPTIGIIDSWVSVVQLSWGWGGQLPLWWSSDVPPSRLGRMFHHLGSDGPSHPPWLMYVSKCSHFQARIAHVQGGGVTAKEWRVTQLCEEECPCIAWPHIPAHPLPAKLLLKLLLRFPVVLGQSVQVLFWMETVPPKCGCNPLSFLLLTKEVKILNWCLEAILGWMRIKKLKLNPDMETLLAWRPVIRELDCPIALDEVALKTSGEGSGSVRGCSLARLCNWGAYVMAAIRSSWHTS